MGQTENDERFTDYLPVAGVLFAIGVVVLVLLVFSLSYSTR
jgi:hypothetical protein